MNSRYLIFVIIFAVAFVYIWETNVNLREEFYQNDRTIYDSDYYLEEFTLLSMDDEGFPARRLSANLLKHNLDDETSELEMPSLEFYRIDEMPIYISAEKGWVLHEDNTIRMNGKVNLWEDNEIGESIINVLTSEASVLLNDDYAESRQLTTIHVENTKVTANWIRAYFKDSRIEVLEHDKTIVSDIDSI